MKMKQKKNKVLSVTNFVMNDLITKQSNINVMSILNDLIKKQGHINVMAELARTKYDLDEIIDSKIPDGADRVVEIARKFKAASFFREITRVTDYINDERGINPEELVFVSKNDLDVLKTLYLRHSEAFPGDYIKLVELFVSPKRWIICWKSPTDI